MLNSSVALNKLKDNLYKIKNRRRRRRRRKYSLSSRRRSLLKKGR
jgi:hypothetical protein